jgi:hypothetical protein
MAQRGTYGFETGDGGRLLDNAANLDRLRRLFRDGAIIDEEFGPGNPGDFDNGSWHILCHLAGGTGVFGGAGGPTWAAITHEPTADRYRATVSFKDGRTTKTVPIGEAAATARLRGRRLVGFVEGSSVGHIAARNVRDARNAFNGWPRQMFDRPASDRNSDGGTVWEQWCVTRDIRPDSPIGDSSLRAYLTLVSLLGGRYVAAVARGRREHEHPRHLCALVKAGVLTRDDALWDVTPRAIPAAAERSLLQARPADGVKAAALLAWEPREPRYYMFSRRIDRWSATAEVRGDLRRYGVP